MAFIWPRLLYFLALVPILVGLYLLANRRKARSALVLSTVSIAQQAVGRSIRRHIPIAFLLAGVAVGIAGIARPTATVVLPSQRGTVILAMDVSGSMRADDIDPSRLVASQVAAEAFVVSQPKDVRIGVVTFGGGSALVQAPTLDRGQVLAAIRRFRTEFGTAIGSGILTSLMAIFEDLQLEVPPAPEFGGGGGGGPGNDPFGGGGGGGRGWSLDSPRFNDVDELPDPVEPGSFESAAIVLLTDGQATHGPDPVQAAQIAADLGIKVYTVGLGTPEGAVLRFRGRSVRVVLDGATLDEIADRTDGEFFVADSTDSLSDIYRSLGTELVLAEEETEITVFFLALALALTLAGASLSVLWFSRLV